MEEKEFRMKLINELRKLNRNLEKLSEAMSADDSDEKEEEKKVFI